MNTLLRKNEIINRAFTKTKRLTINNRRFQLCLTLILFLLPTAFLSSQTFNLLYRQDSAQRIALGNFNVFVKDSIIFTTGPTLQRLDPLDSNSLVYAGILSKLNMQGGYIRKNILTNPDTFTTNELLVNTSILNSKGQIVNIAYNRDRSASLIVNDFETSIVINKKYFPDSINGIGTINTKVRGIEETYDKGYFMTLQQQIQNLKSYALIIKTDSLGNQEWQRNYGDDRIFSYPNGGVYNIGITRIGNNRYVLAHLKSAITGTGDIILSYLSVHETDTLGNILRTYETSDDRYLYCTNIITTKDSSIITYGNESYRGNRIKEQGYLLKVKNNTLVWEKKIGSADGICFVSKLIELGDGSLLGVGHEVVRYPADTALPFDSVHLAGLLFRMDRNGNLLWKRNYTKGSFHREGIPYHYLMSLAVVPADSSIILCGSTRDWRFASPIFGDWAWLLRVDKYGCLRQGCHLRDATKDTPLSIRDKISVYPNPAQDFCHLEWQTPTTPNSLLVLYDFTGKAVLEKNIGAGYTELDIDTQNLPNGIYIYKLLIKGKGQATGKMMIAR